jgi:hypothetical protein
MTVHLTPSEDVARGVAIGVEDLSPEPFHEYEPVVRECFRVMCRVGRNEGPFVLWEWWKSRRLQTQHLGPLVADAWSAAEFPEDLLGRRAWVELFSTAGYVKFVSDTGRPVPRAPLTVYRGAIASCARRMSWTTERTIAERFAYDGLRGRLPGKVYSATAPPRAVLAYIDDPDGRNEAEVVVNPRLLRGLRAASTG